MFTPYRWIALSGVTLIALSLSACNGSSSSTSTSTTTTPTATYTVGGSISGLASGQSVTLLDNGGDGYVATANGTFTFASALATGAAYAVTVGTQPTIQSCAVVNGTGTVANAAITNVAVNCITHGQVSTFAGSTASGSADGTGSAASFNFPARVATDASGTIYVADQNNHEIRRITPAGVVTTLAGSGVPGFTDGTGSAASFSSPNGVAVDASGNVYVADYNNNEIRKITPAGVVTTLAGSTTAGHADGTGSAASFNHPGGVTVDSSGNVYVADTQNYEIRKITPTGVVTTLAGSITSGHADGTGSAASFGYPLDLAVDASGNIYVADYSNNEIRKVTPAGAVTTLAGSLSLGSADGTGSAASFYNPTGVAVDTSGNVYVADTSNNEIRKITPAGVVTTLAGSTSPGSADGIGAAASFRYPFGVAADSSSGNLYVYVADAQNNEIRLLTP